MKYQDIPEKIIRRFAKQKEIKNLRGKQVEEIIDLLIKADFSSELEYLNDQFSFSGKIGGLIIDKPINEFPVKDENRFIENLIEKNLIINDALNEKKWVIRYDDNIQICGITLDGQSVFLRTVERRTNTYSTGWNNKGQNDYAYFSSIIIHFSNQVIEYRCPITYVNKYQKFILPLQGYESSKVESMRLTKLSPTDAENVKTKLKATYSATHISTPSSVGSIKFTSSNSTIDLATDTNMQKIMTALGGVVPTDDHLDVVCYLPDYIDPRTKLSLPFSFEINMKSGGLKFLGSSLVTQSAIDHVVEAIIQVSYIDKLDNSMVSV
ncbi:hypothetical protein IBBPl23_23 [Paenibacillus phage phiIBB_P123]|uniref:Uncharacterized protein n=1 Tax=Paenibacillus phage phiIBB_P123 TaxID=1337877 RepID=R9VW17_9CAUD|nr:hypothetical protein IBBPl23_23 [Paenibacillus phage phiIBB_P123]AGN89338.1 hypothetical protein IBBPl23_23 [Paenibacillus phage phiIBB_P123]